MKLPNSERAFVDMVKLIGYSLNAEHPLGKHKARVFASTLGITTVHAEELQRALLDAALIYDAVPTAQDEYGQRYVVDFTMTGPAGRARVRSTWIILRSEDFPRLTSCYVL